MKTVWMKFWSRLREYLPEALDRGREARRLLAVATRLASEAPPDPRLQHRAQGASPLISLVAPLYNTKRTYLEDLVHSFEQQHVSGQTSGLFELILSDDGSTSPETLQWLAANRERPFIRVVLSERNRGIAAATNSGIHVAKGEWIALIDHDDAVAPFALDRLARALMDNPHAKFLYTDEVITNDVLDPEGYFLKPAWDEVLLSGMNYINHFSCYRRDRLLNLGLLRESFQGSQDYDLLLRYTRDLSASEILHLPYPAYLWRRDGVSYSAKFMDKATGNARKALAERYQLAAGPAGILPAIDPNLHRVDFARTRAAWPLVSVIIPSRNAPHLVRQVMQGLLEKTDYPALEILIIDNGTENPEVLELYRQWENGTVPFRAIIRTGPFNFSRAINRGVAEARGEVLLLLNNDIEMQESGWLKEMVSCLSFPATGIVGAKLLYPDRTLQHAGVIAGLGGLAGHWFIRQSKDFPGPMGRLRVRQSLSVVTGACLLVTRACWDTTGPLDEDKFAIAYNDVDFCLRAVANGFRVIWTPFAELIHHESASRGSDETPANIARFLREQANLRERHCTETLVDRAFNPWWTRGHSIPESQFLTKLPDAR